jgi:hypothetical protein
MAFPVPVLTMLNSDTCISLTQNFTHWTIIVGSMDRNSSTPVSMAFTVPISTELIFCWRNYAQTFHTAFTPIGQEIQKERIKIH